MSLAAHILLRFNGVVVKYTSSSEVTNASKVLKISKKFFKNSSFVSNLTHNIFLGNTVDSKLSVHCHYNGIDPLCRKNSGQPTTDLTAKQILLKRSCLGSKHICLETTCFNLVYC